jgi:hypothetical protein
MAAFPSGRSPRLSVEMRDCPIRGGPEIKIRGCNSSVEVWDSLPLAAFYVLIESP